LLEQLVHVQTGVARATAGRVRKGHACLWRRWL
jgi:hypothetical protein